MVALRADYVGLWHAVKFRVIKPIVEPARNRLHQRRRRHHSIANPALVQSLKLPRPTSRPFPAVTAFRLGLQGAGSSRARWMATGAMHGLEIRDPTRDRRMVEFCWRLPDEVYWANGRQRGLIRAGMAHDLPVEIRDETRKGLQSSDILVRFRVQSAEINAALDRIAGNAIASDYLNSGALRKIFDGIVAGGNSLPEVAEAHLLARGISVGYFLASQIR
jgi:hypothetical protein